MGSGSSSPPVLVFGSGVSILNLQSVWSFGLRVEDSGSRVVVFEFELRVWGFGLRV